MRFFDSFFNKVGNWLDGNDQVLNLQGMTPEQILFVLTMSNSVDWLLNKKRSFLFIFDTPEQAERTYQETKQAFLKHPEDWHVAYFPGHDFNPYSSMLGSENDLLSRFEILTHLERSKKNFIIFTTPEALSQKQPPRSFFANNQMTLNVSDVIEPSDLAKKLVELGFSRTPTVEEPGTFSQKGEIFDIYPMGDRPYRIHFFDELIEEIWAIDRETYKTVPNSQIESITTGPAQNIFCQNEFTLTLRKNIPQVGPRFRNRFETRKHVFANLQEGILFNEFTKFVPLFFEESATLLDYLPNDLITIVFSKENCERDLLDYFDDIRTDFEELSENIEDDSLLVSPENFYEFDVFHAQKLRKRIETEDMTISFQLDTSMESILEINLEPASHYFARLAPKSHSEFNNVKDKINVLVEQFSESGQILFCYKSSRARDEFKFLLEGMDNHQNLFSRLHYQKIEVGEGFYYSLENTLVLSEGDLFAKKVSKAKRQKEQNFDVFAEQLSTLSVGDYIVHKMHGVGKYMGLQSLEGSGMQGDFIVIEYDGQDKVYLPVYKMELIQKHADSTAEHRLANLNTRKFDAQKTKARESVKKLAIDLLRLQAQRESQVAFSFSPPDHDYREFELAFPFNETNDQAAAIADVLDDMQSTKPMDRLICGDVGFGKTEVAMRAAYKAVLDSKQVAILVPTTVLSLQHFSSFKRRFKKFPVEIEFLSRFKTAAQTREIKQKLEDGKIDIIIGTHKLLGNDIKYKDLGLVIVDEEQRFGVGHKEKLKTMKASVDFLTLTATPIPRTLQLSYLGLRDLSLIRTPPHKRQAIKTYVIRKDDKTLQKAIEKEINRGGQVFFVHNRVNDIDQVEAYIKRLVPKAKIIVGHGQLQERELEKRMQAFYSGSYDILLATTIIESGIDIPTANTMIIDRADAFGVSQLHQLRGRIGRSDRKAYAYFMVPQNRNLSTIAAKRLKALQTYADLGGGFSIASCDLEIRGAGDILGGEQSGHIESVGLELYLDLLKEAIEDLRGEKKVLTQSVEIAMPHTAFIPNTYIEDSGLRLKYYKKLSSCSDNEELEKYYTDFEDIYGEMPNETKNLFIVLEAKLQFQKIGVKNVKCSSGEIQFVFDKELIETNEQLREKAISYFMSRPRLFKLNPDFSVNHRLKEKFRPETLLSFSKDIAQSLDLC